MQGSIGCKETLGWVLGGHPLNGKLHLAGFVAGSIEWKETLDRVLGRHPLNGRLHLQAVGGWFD